MIKPSSHINQPRDELETLRILLNLPPEILGQFEPCKPPKHVAQYVAEAPTGELQWLLIDVLHQLRVRARQQRHTHHST
ncbi:MAG: hypothetical protein WD468_13025 [Pirellulales bacterium]